MSLIAVPLLKRLGPVAVSAYSCLISVPMLASWMVVADGASLPAPTLGQLAALAYLGSIVTVGGFVLWYAAIGLLGAERAGLFSGVLPISALGCASIIGAGEVTLAQLGAIGVVLVGITVGMRVAPTPDGAPSDDRNAFTRRGAARSSALRSAPGRVRRQPAA
jgi:drug/metabolite transporter (DMT)-like permease